MRFQEIDTVPMFVAVAVVMVLEYISLFNSEKKICSMLELHERLTQVKLTSLYTPLSNLGMER